MIKPLLPKTAWLIPILLFTAAYAQAQDSTAHQYRQDSTAYRYSQDSVIKITVVPQGKYSSILYTANGKVLTKQELIARIQLYDLSASEYQKYRNSKVGMLVWGRRLHRLSHRSRPRGQSIEPGGTLHTRRDRSIRPDHGIGHRHHRKPALRPVYSKI